MILKNYCFGQILYIKYYIDQNYFGPLDLIARVSYIHFDTGDTFIEHSLNMYTFETNKIFCVCTKQDGSVSSISSIFKINSLELNYS